MTTFFLPKKTYKWGKLGVAQVQTESRDFFSVSFWRSEANPIIFGVDSGGKIFGNGWVSWFAFFL